MIGTTCIVPVFNEKGRIGNILSELLTVPEISHIICVDESNDGSDEEIKQFAQVKLMHFSKRLGKTEAVRRGVEATKTKNALLFDSDFVGFSKNQLVRGLHIFKTEKMDMLVFRQASNTGFHKWTNLDLSLSGERLMKTEDLRKILQQPAEGYQLELHINSYYESLNKIVYYLPLTGHNSFKFLRRGFWGGMTDGLTMMRQTFRYRGIYFYLRTIVGCNWKEWVD